LAPGGKIELLATYSILASNLDIVWDQKLWMLNLWCEDYSPNSPPARAYDQNCATYRDVRLSDAALRHLLGRFVFEC
jgi:hypothetical protein